MIMYHHRNRFRRYAIALLATSLTTASASACDVPCNSAASTLIAGYWSEFVDHWLGHLKQQNGVVMFALGVGAVSLLIITRGKWKK